MSRRSFRGRVEAPRPASAWVLVTVASASLWITQQLDPLAIAVQVSAILFSLWRRGRPLRFQQSGVWLNAGMLAIVAVTIAVALGGEPSTIALAHFAALTQGLQLLDARPRHTEFLLVTLALFQVVLAANLTDSVFFPPLLAAFVLATVWTLLVHTLRTEAIEAGDPHGVSRAITPGLLHVTLLVSGLSVLLALLLFVTLPRLRSSVVTGSGMGGALATAGFSDTVALGELGAIRQDPTVVMRIETLEGDAPLPGEGYWRGLAFDHFDGRSWSITPSGRQLVAGSAEGGVSFGRRPEQQSLVQNIVREPVEAGVLFGAGDPRELQGTVRRLERDESGGLYAAGQAADRLRYRIATYHKPPSEAALRRDLAVPEPRHPERTLQLPPLSAEIEALALRIAGDAGSDAERARAVERHLVTTGRYTNVPPSLPADASVSPIEAFLLGSLAGHCEYFASGMVVLLRELGIPSRLVNGFAGGHLNEIGGFLEVTRSDAHTWVEVHYDRAGWVRYDPTPPDLRARPAAVLSLSERVRQLASAAELWWFQRVVGFDRADQIHALRRAWLAWRESRGDERGGAVRRPGRRAFADLRALGDALALPAAVAVAGALGFALLRRRRAPQASVPASYLRALRLLARRGHRRGATHTARDFAASVRAREAEAVARAFDALTDAYLAERFGGYSPAADAVAERLAALARALRAARAQPSPSSRPEPAR